MIVMPFIARAEDVPINPNAKIITDSYLQGALLNKQDKLSDANIIVNGDDTGDVITNISASDGVLTITKGTMPSGVNVVYDGNADFPVGQFYPRRLPVRSCSCVCVSDRTVFFTEKVRVPKIVRVPRNHKSPQRK